MLYGSFWPSIKDQPSMSDFMNQMPEAMRSMFAMSGADLSTPAGYAKVELMSFIGPILVILYAVSAGNAAVAGEEDRHTMDLLLANPISRTRLVLDKLGAMIIGILLITAVAGASLLLSGPVFGLSIAAGKAAAAMVHLGLLGLVFGALALAIGATTGRTGASRGVPAGHSPLTAPNDRTATPPPTCLASGSESTYPPEMGFNRVAFITYVGVPLARQPTS